MDLQYTTECGACWDKYEGVSPPSLSRKIINTINIVSKWIETAASSVISKKKNLYEVEHGTDFILAQTVESRSLDLGSIWAN